MGEVYLATDRSLRRRAALKVIPPRPRRRARRGLQVPCRSSSRCSPQSPAHRHRLRDRRVQGARPYLALEYVEGCSLRERMDRAPLGPRDWDPRLPLQSPMALPKPHRNGRGARRPQARQRALVLRRTRTHRGFRPGATCARWFGLGRRSVFRFRAAGDPGHTGLHGSRVLARPACHLRPAMSGRLQRCSWSSQRDASPFSAGQVARGVELSGIVRDALHSCAAVPQPVIDLVARAPSTSSQSGVPQWPSSGSPCA